jgi:hypothetical protein
MIWILAGIVALAAGCASLSGSTDPSPKAPVPNIPEQPEEGEQSSDEEGPPQEAAADPRCGANQIYLESQGIRLHRTRGRRTIEGTVKDLCVDTAAATNGQYESFVKATTSDLKDIYVLENRPTLDRSPDARATGVMVRFAKAYCEKEGKRLPTVLETVLVMNSQKVPFVNTPAKEDVAYTWVTDPSKSPALRVGRNAKGAQIVTTPQTPTTSSDMSFFCVSDPVKPSPKAEEAPTAEAPKKPAAAKPKQKPTPPPEAPAAPEATEPESSQEDASE